MQKLETGIFVLDDHSKKTSFLLTPDTDARAQMATELGFSAIRKLRFDGSLQPDGQKDWVLSGTLGATIVQPCSITLEPVITRIDTSVSRSYRAAFSDPENAGEFEIPEDETIEPLPKSLDLNVLLAEALSLAAPDFLKADGVQLETSNFTAPGAVPMTDEDARPFAGLEALKNKLAGNDDP